MAANFKSESVVKDSWFACRGCKRGVNLALNCASGYFSAVYPIFAPKYIVWNLLSKEF